MIDIVKRTDNAIGFQVLPKRWIVERTIAWISRFRRLARDFERYAGTVAAFMRWTGANERTVKNWLGGKIGPRGEHLVDVIRHSDATLNAVLQLAGRPKTIAASKLIYARNLLAETVERIDTYIVGSESRI